MTEHRFTVHLDNGDWAECDSEQAAIACAKQLRRDFLDLCYRVAYQPPPPARIYRDGLLIKTIEGRYVNG
jgi:hypothetical protein